jgi:hypothetical protein
MAAEGEQRKSSEGGAGELCAELSSDHELFVRDWKEFVKADGYPRQMCILDQTDFEKIFKPES